MRSKYALLLRFGLTPFFVAALLGAALVSPALAQWEARNPVTAVQSQPDGAIFTMKTGTLRLQVCSDSIIHVLYSPTSSFPASRPDPVIIKTSWPATKFTMQTDDDSVTLTTAQIKLSSPGKTEPSLIATSAASNWCRKERAS
jgi:hypothetical protein